MSGIRLATARDADALAELVQSLGYQPSRPRSELAADTAAALLRGATIYVAEGEGGRLDGYLSVHWLDYLLFAGPDAFVSELFVRDGRRGAGVGSALLAAVEHEARRRGCHRLHLVQRREREAYRRGYYAARGFTERTGVADFVREL